MALLPSLSHRRDLLRLLLIIYWILYGVFMFTSIPFYAKVVLFFLLITTSSLYYGLKGGLVATAYYIGLTIISHYLFTPVTLYGLFGGISVGVLISLLIGLHQDQIENRDRALRENEARYRELFEHSLNGLSLHEVIVEGERVVDFLCLKVNRAFLEQVGYREEEILWKRGREIFPGLDEDSLHICGQVALTGEPYKAETYLSFLKGWFEISIFSHQRGYFILSITNISQRKEAEEALRSSKEEVEALFSTIPGVIYRAQLKEYRNIEYVSSKIQGLMGFKEIRFYQEESFFASRIHYEDRGWVEARIKELIAMREDYFLEYRIIDSEGEVTWISDQGYGVFDEKDELLYLYGFLLDITPRKEAEESLEKSEYRFRSYAQNAGEIIFSLSSDGSLTYVSPQWTQELGHAVSEVEGMNFAPFVHQGDLYSCLEYIHSLLESGERVKDFEFRARHKEGGYRWMRTSATLAYDEKEDMPYIVGIARNITQEKKDQEALKLLSIEQKMILNTILPHVWTIKSDYTYGKVNTSHARFYGLPLEQMEGRKIIDVHGEEEGDLWIHILEKAFEVREQFHVKEWVLDHADKSRLLAITITPHFEKEEVDYVICSAEDITDQERERRLLANESAILSLIAKSMAQLTSILERICHLIENQKEGDYAAISVFHEESRTFTSVVAPTLGEYGEYFVDREVSRESFFGQSIYSKERVLLEDIGSDRFKDFKEHLPEDISAYYSQPILSQDERVLGTVDIYSKAPGGPDSFTRRLMETGASLAGIAIERNAAESKINEYTMAMELKNMELEELYKKIDEEVEKAQKIHYRTLPTTFPSMERLSIYAHYKPAAKMGGDFYNFKKIQNRLLFYLSDVTGHGLDGAMMSIFVKNTIDNYLSLAPHHEILPSRIFTYLTNQYLNEGFPEDYFISLLLGIIDLSKGELFYSSAGLHVSPIMLSKDGAMVELKAGNLPISSTIPSSLLEYNDERIEILPGSTLFFSTDGLTEQSSKDDGWYGNRFQDILSRDYYLPPAVIAQALNEDFRLFSGQETGDDDITFLILQMESEEEVPSLSLSIESSYSNLKKAKEEVGSFLSEYLQDLEDIHEVMISFHELFINAMEHGNKERGEISVKIEVYHRFLKLTVGDEGEGFDWEERLEQNPFQLKEENFIRGRGLGIMLTSIASDYYYYSPQGDEATIIKLRR